MTAARELASLPLRDRVAAVIDASGLDQEAFADRIGVARETVSRWVNGRAKPGRPYRFKLAECASQYFDETISPDLFRDGEGDPIELEQAVRTLAEATTELIELLAEQRVLVDQMNRIASVLERREASEGS